MKRYNPKEIEPKWQKAWEDSGIYRATEDSSKPKRYVLEYFPYPSGGAMHVGHVRNYTIGDAVARFHRMQGENVLHPMGWDAFGLPAENFAIKNNISPKEAIKRNTTKFKQQLTQMGFSYDWSREVDSSDPTYYKWTQWFFKLLFERGLAYQKESLQWWCETDKTVLANEQVEAGNCWRCGNPVTKKSLKQWFFKITDYADRLADDLDKLDWSDSIKAMQRNWIGKSIGAEINFRICHAELVEGSSESSSSSVKSDDIITVFTTRADTLFGATFMVLAPEHPLVQTITTKEQKPAVENYIKQSQTKSEIERQETNREKTGVFTGAYVINPINNEKIPVWVADYVLAGYGTGAVMAVPGHDERDNEFAKKFDLPIIEVVAPDFGTPLPDAVDVTGPVVVGYDPNTKEFMSLINTRNNMRWLVSGGLNEGEDYETAALRELKEEAGYHKVKKLIRLGGPTYSYYYNSNKDSNRRSLSYLYLAVLDKESQGEQALESHEQFEVSWSSLEELVKDFEKESDGRGHWIDGMARAKEAVEALEKDEEYTGPFIGGEGVLFNSDKYNGLTTSEAREEIIADLHKIEFEPTFRNAPGSEDSVKEDLPFIEREAITAIVKHWNEDKYLCLKWKTADWDTFLTGGVDEGYSAEEAAVQEILEETGYKNPKLVKNLGRNHAQFYHVPKKENRFAHFTCLYFELEDGAREEVSEEEQKNHEVVWLTPQEVENFRLPASHRFIWNKFIGKESTSHAGREVVNYKIRDWLISRQRYWGAPIPIIHCEKDGAVAVPDEQLPVVLPEVESYQPTGEGTSVLAGVYDWVNTTCPKCGGPAKRETDTMDGFACSSWYFLRFADPHNDKQPFSKEKARFWLPVDDYIGGAEHAVMHLLYARMWTKVMFDAGLIEFDEPFKALRNHGMILAPDGRKMSKSWNNVIAPDEIIEQGYGADAVRLMELFIGPWNQEAAWSVEGMGGCFRFLQRVWGLIQEFLEADLSQAGSQPEVLVTTHRAIKKVSKDLTDMGFNTAIAALMGLTNDLYKLKTKQGFSDRDVWQSALSSFVQLLAPFAPHIAEELWRDLGNTESVHITDWPAWDESLLVSDTIKIVVQVNGKVRATIEVPSDSVEAEVVQAAKASEKVAAQIGSTEIKKTIYVPDKLVNFVV